MNVMLLLLASVLLGCSGGGNSKPTAITPDEQRQMDEAQAKVNAEESVHRKSVK
jgi:hypothetical protein